MDAEQQARAWLLARGADGIDHPGGTLLAHLGRVHDRLAALGGAPALCLAGLTHAAYGTDGFPRALLDPADRTPLVELVGADAEEQVFRYGGCSRTLTWGDLGRTRTVVSRFTGDAEVLAPDALRAFVDLSVVNELDVVEQQPAVLAEHGEWFRRTFAGWAHLASPAVVADAERVLGSFTG